MQMLIERCVEGVQPGAFLGEKQSVGRMASWPKGRVVIWNAGCEVDQEADGKIVGPASR